MTGPLKFHSTPSTHFPHLPATREHPTPQARSSQPPGKPPWEWCREKSSHTAAAETRLGQQGTPGLREGGVRGSKRRPRGQGQGSLERKEAGGRSPACRACHWVTLCNLTWAVNPFLVSSVCLFFRVNQPSFLLSLLHFPSFALCVQPGGQSDLPS